MNGNPFIIKKIAEMRSEKKLSLAKIFEYINSE
jgi:hypothetical protein